MTSEKNKNSESGTNKSDQECSQSDQPQSTASESTGPFTEAVKQGLQNPNEARREGLLNSIEHFHRREQGRRLKKVKAPRGKPQGEPNE